MAKRRASKASFYRLGLGDPQVMKRLEDAARAAGLGSVEELVDLIVDSGVSARPPVDPLTERMTLQDLGERLWVVATATQRDARREWFERLAPVQQTAIVTVLRTRGYSAIAISNDFGIEQLEVERIYAEHTTKLGAQVLGVRLDTLAGQISEAKQRAQQIAAEKGDGAALWRIEKEFVGVMQDLGVLERAAHKVEVVGRASEAKAAALQQITELAEKRARRRIEIQKVDKEVIDAAPESLEESYEALKES